MSIDYSIRVDFDKEDDSPSRVFFAMGLFIEGFNDIQEAFISGFGNDIQFSSSLDKTREGSCIADIRIAAREMRRKVSLNNIMELIYHGAREELSTIGKLDSEGDFKRFSDHVYSHVAANESDLESFTSHGEPDLYKLASGCYKISSGKSYLTEKDTVQFGRGGDLKDLSDNMACPRKPDEIFEDTDTQYSGSELFVVRRPAYVKQLQWDFECEKRTPKKFSAKMCDDKWFSDWSNHKKELWPGDAIRVKTRTTIKRNKIKKTKRIEYEVVEVVGIVKREELAQLSLDLNYEA